MGAGGGGGAGRDKRSARRGRAQPSRERGAEDKGGRAGSGTGPGAGREPGARPRDAEGNGAAAERGLPGPREGDSSTPKCPRDFGEPHKGPRGAGGKGAAAAPGAGCPKSPHLISLNPAMGLNRKIIIILVLGCFLLCRLGRRLKHTGISVPEWGQQGAGPHGPLTLAHPGSSAPTATTGTQVSLMLVTTRDWS